MDDISAPRPLTSEETDELKATLKSHLRLHNSPCAFQAEADADDLLNYALDMIEDGNTIQHVCEELEFMEMSICDVEVLEKIKMELCTYMTELTKKVKKGNWRDNNYLLNTKKNKEEVSVSSQRPPEQSRQSPPSRQTPQAARRAREEAERSAAAAVINDEPSPTEENEEEDTASRFKLEPPKKTGNYLIDQMAMDEYKERLKEIERQRRSGSNPQSGQGGGARDSPQRSSSVRLSSKKTGGRDSPQRSSSVRLPKKTEGNNYLIDSINVERRTSLPATTTRKPLYESRPLPPPVNKRASAPPQDTTSRTLERELLESDNYVVEDFSAAAAANKAKREMELLFRKSQGSGGAPKASSLKDRYQQSLIADKVDNKKKSALWSARDSSFNEYEMKDVEEEQQEYVPPPSSPSRSSIGGGRPDEQQLLDQQRRAELQLIMRDKSLNKEERRLKMDEVRDKYASGDVEIIPVSSPSPSGSPRSSGVVSPEPEGDIERTVSTNGTGSLPTKKTNSELRREEMMAIMKDKTLSKQEKAIKMDEVKAKYSDETASLHSSGQGYKRGNSSNSAISSTASDTNNNVVEINGIPAQDEYQEDEEEEELPPAVPAPPKKTGNYLIDQMAMEEYEERMKAFKQLQRERNKQKKKDESESMSPQGSSSTKPKQRSSLPPKRTGGSNYLIDQFNAERRASQPPPRKPLYENRPIPPPVNRSSSPPPQDRARSLEQELLDSDNYVEKDFSAAAAANKAKREMESLFGNGGASAAARSNRLNYEQQLEADRVNNKLGVAEPISVVKDEKSSTLLDRLQRPSKNGSKVAPTAASSSSPPQSSQLDQQRRAELQLIMRDKSLNKEERRLKMDEVRDKYAELALLEEEEGGLGCSS